MKNLSLFILVAGLGLGLASPGDAAGQAAARLSVMSGVYSEAQAIRGQTLYYQHCLACHGEMMQGVDQAPPLAGPQFGSNWNGESLWSIVERIGTMPPEKPGTLAQQEMVDVLTYILWFNGLPLGNEALGTQRDGLMAMPFELPPPGQ